MSKLDAPSLDTDADSEQPIAGPRRPNGGGRGYNPLVQLTLARIREFVREPEALFWVFVFPVLLAFVLGIAFRNTGPQKLRVAVEAAAGQPGEAGTEGLGSKQEDLAGRVAAAISKSPGLVGIVLPHAEAARQLRTGKVELIVRADSDPAARSKSAGQTPAAPPEGSGASGSDPNFEYQFDPTRPESQTARLSVDDALQRAFGRRDVALTADQTVVEPGARYIDFLIPGLIGLNLMGSGMWGLGFALVQARNRKLLKRLAATPMRRSHFLLSFMLSRLAFLSFEVAMVVAFGWVVFGVAVHGSIVSLGLIALIGSLSFAGVGLLVASRPKTIEGVSGMMNLVMLPMWLLSGTFFSYARFPDFLQPAIKALPLTALNDALRAVMNDGSSLSSNWVALAVLAGWGLISFVVALKIFRWQ
jgi:ABC-type polysaccharide/polyol phosphate export permease